jgi:cytochrome c556
LPIIGAIEIIGGHMKNIFQSGMLVAGIGLMLVAATVSVTAQDSKEALIKTRQDFMKAQGADVKAISDYSKGQGDKAAALTAANDLVARGPKIADLFPPGTSSVDFPGKSNAKPELWTEMDKAKAIWTALAAEEVKLVDVVKNGDQKAVADQLGAMGKAGCGACHGAYRVKTS